MSDPNILSGHCCVHLKSCNTHVLVSKTQNKTKKATLMHHTFINGKTYTASLCSNSVKYELENICQNVADAVNNNETDQSLNTFCKILEDVYVTVCLKVKNNINPSIRENNTYFNNDCSDLKKKYYRCLNSWRINQCYEWYKPVVIIKILLGKKLYWKC